MGSLRAFQAHYLLTSLRPALKYLLNHDIVGTLYHLEYFFTSWEKYTLGFNISNGFRDTSHHTFLWGDISWIRKGSGRDISLPPFPPVNHLFLETPMVCLGWTGIQTELGRGSWSSGGWLHQGGRLRTWWPTVKMRQSGCEYKMILVS